MNRTAVASELVKVAMLLSADDDPMAGERIPSLYVKLETWCVKKVTSLPASAPVANQIMKGLQEVKRKLKGKEHLTGREAVKAMMEAMKGTFTMDAPPIPSLIRKYGLSDIREMFDGWR